MRLFGKLFGRSEKRGIAPGERSQSPVADAGRCIATRQIAAGGKKVGYMYREKCSFDGDSGWRFFSGDESPSEVDDARQSAVCELKTITDCDPAVARYLSAAPGSAFGRIAGTDEFEREDLTLESE